MRLVVIGSAGSYPSADSACSAYLVQADDDAGRTWTVLLDLGNGALGPLQRFWNVRDIDAIGLSHLHADHVADMAVLSVARRYRPGGPLPSIPVWGPEGTDDRLIQLAGKDDPAASTDGQFDVHVWDPALPVVVGPLTLTPVPMNHSVPCFGVRVVGPAESSAARIVGTGARARGVGTSAGARGGGLPGEPGATVTLAYTGDTDAGPGLDALADDADLLLAEAAFHEGRDDAFRGIHLTGQRAAESAARGGTRHLVLTHVPAWNDPSVTLAEAGRAYDGLVTLAIPGARFLL
ncbi:MAG TPA: MBL fold metallo-hydrolase [Cellulomonas sp.]